MDGNAPAQSVDEILHSSPVGISVWRRCDWTIVDINDEFLRIFGLSRGEVVGRTVDELGLEIEPGQREAMLCEFLEKGRCSPRALPVRRKDGAVATILISASALSRGAEPHAIVWAMDITERLGIEETLRNSEEKWRTLVENAPVVSLTADRAGMIRTINRSLTGRTPADFVGKCIHDFTLTDADRQRSVDCLQRVVASGRAESFAVDSFAPDGRPVRLRNVLAPIVSGGQVTSVIGVAMDVSAETEAFIALRESEARLRDIVERMGDWLVECDPSSRLTYSSPQVRQLLGYTAEEMIGKSPMETVMPEEREHLAAAMAEFLRAKTPIRDVEVWHLRKDGHRVCLSVSGAPILDEGGGEVRGMRAVVHDVTERKNFEAKMLQAQKLESLGILAGGIDHDFNNLLAAILGNAEIALAELPSDGAARESIEQIEKAGLHAAQLTRQMLAYAGRGSITLQPVAVPDVVRDIFELLRSSISKRHEFVVDFPEGLPAVMGDPSQVRQIVMNLVMNASEAIGEGGGVISVRGAALAPGMDVSGDFSVGDLADKPHVLLEVNDTGEGMDARTLARIFAPFFTRKFAGRGLGLAAVLGIVRRHGGALRVRSRPGAGTSFSVLLPACEGNG